MAANVVAMFESFAQNGEDIILWRALGDIENGTYVDVGAADPNDDSVTRAFYERGWSGLNIEPAHDYATRLAAARPRDTLVEACAGSEEGTIVLHHVLDTGLSSVLDSAVHDLDDTTYDVVDVEVPVKRLDTILAESGLTPNNPIHFLKIDVEGFEESVIRGIDLSVWRPWVIVAESTRPRSSEQAHHEWEPLLLDHGYEFCLFDGLNRYYVAQEHGALKPLLSYPPCVFDQPYLTPAHAELLREHESALAAYGELEDVHQQTLANWRELEAVHQQTLASWRELEDKYNGVVHSWSTLETEYQNVVAALERLGVDYAALQTERDRFADERIALRDGIAHMGEELDTLRSERDAARHELALTRETLSWRVTRPLREVRRLGAH